MSLFAESLLRAAGLEYDEIEETWVARITGSLCLPGYF